MSNSDLSIIILAAGKGTRMKSAIPKSMHKIAGRRMTDMVIDISYPLNPLNICLVISEEMQVFCEEIRQNHPQLDINFAFQKQRLGTGDAVRIAVETLPKIGNKILILYADTPLLNTETLQNMVESLQNTENSICVLGFDCFSSNKYGRLIVKNNKLEQIVEFNDADSSQRQITLCNSGVIAADGTKIKELLSLLDNNNAAGEYYLTDIIAIAQSKNLSCGFIKANEEEVMGVNSRRELAKAEKVKQQYLREKFMDNGVTLLDPDSVYFSFDTRIDADVTIEPHIFFGCGVVIESGAYIKSFSHIESAVIKNNAAIGPFARIRPQTVIGIDAKIGNFVEIKKSNIKKGAKISHLSYIGDSQIGENANIGAGTITCNYDGYNKFKTNIGDNVFIGSNSALIAPVNIGNNAVIGAGSVISKDVEDNDMAVSRARQLNLKGAAEQYHKKRINQKKKVKADSNL